MPLPKSLSEFQEDLQLLLLDDVAGALQLLQKYLPNGSAHFNTVVGLIARLNDANRARLRGTVSNEELQRAYNTIRADFLDLLTILTEADFETENATNDGKLKNGPKHGNVLYRIPNLMPLGKETKCMVRIAIDEDAIIENITLDEYVNLQALARISDLMMVELTDPSAAENFKIRTTSASEQIITAEGYSEWFFYVQPLRAGAFPLEIKVAVIELVMGREAKKEYVLSEMIQIVAEGILDDASISAEMKPAGIALNWAGEAQTPISRVVETTPQPAKIISTDSINNHEAPPRAKTPMAMRTTALLLAVLVLGSATTWAVTPASTVDYWMARWDNSEKTYDIYLEKYPDSRYREEVMYRRALLSDKAAFYRQYLSEYGQRGQYKERISRRIEALETERYIQVSKNISVENVRDFLRDFPETNRISDLKKNIDSQSNPDTSALGLLERAAIVAIQRSPTELKVRNFMKDFPKSNRLSEINAAIAQQPELQELVQPVLEEAYIRQIIDNPSGEQVKAFFQEFPTPTKMEQLKTIVKQSPELSREFQKQLRRREKK